MSAVMANPVGVQEPRISWVPEFVSSTGEEALELCDMAGLYLDPWQKYVLVNSLGERFDGKWSAFEIGVNVPRQNGKGGLIEARELVGMFLVNEGLIIHSAHQFDTSIEAFLRMEAILEGAPDLSRRIRRVSRSHGSEGFALKSGQRLRYRTRTKGGGRGFTGDLLILDEAMILPTSFHGTLIPTLSAKSVLGNPQVWYTGSAVDQTIHEDGIVFARIRERGLRGDDPSLAYFEWSAVVLDDDGKPVNPGYVDEEFLRDTSLWAQANPGLGIRIAEEHIERERISLGAREFAVERLGIGDWPATDDDGAAVIDLDLWDELKDVKSKLLDPVCLAFDISPDRSSASISSGGLRRDGRAHTEVIEHRRGTGWVVARLEELNKAHSPVGIVCDGAGQASSLVAEIESVLDIEVRVVNSREHANACGSFFDRVEQKTLRHLGTGELRNALKGAAKRALGDAWAWARRPSMVDITPLVACTLALWGSDNIEPEATKVWRPL